MKLGNHLKAKENSTRRGKHSGQARPSSAHRGEDAAALLPAAFRHLGEEGSHAPRWQLGPRERNAKRETLARRLGRRLPAAPRPTEEQDPLPAHLAAWLAAPCLASSAGKPVGLATWRKRERRKERKGLDPSSSGRSWPPAQPVGPSGCRWRAVAQEGSDNRWDHEGLAMGIAGLILFLLGLGLLDPALPAPAQPVCDQSVVNRFIQEATKMEGDVVALCKDSCDLLEHVTVMDTRVNFPDWKAMNRSGQASEVWRGQALLSTAIGHVKSQQPAMRAFLRQLEVVESTLRSIREILRRHNAQRNREGLLQALQGQAQDRQPTSIITCDVLSLWVTIQWLQTDPQDETPVRTLNVHTVKKLFSIYSSFLRGKINLFLATVCQRSGS